MRIYSLILWHCIIASLVWLNAANQAKAAEPAESRLVIVKVMDEKGSAMAGVQVSLIGTDRDTPDSDAPSRFISDAEGQCQVKLGCLPGTDNALGWGHYYFFAEAKGLRGVSKRVVHMAKGEEDSGEIGDEWTRRGSLKTSAKPLVVPLRMVAGIRVEGRVVDRMGHPVRGFEVPIQEDLHKESHTGVGAEIFPETTFTDSQGRFFLTGVYPNTFYPQVMINEEKLPAWVRTEVRGKWISQPVYSVTPHKHEKVVRLTLEVAKTLPYRCYGRVVNRAGRPVGGAQITVCRSWHDPTEDYADDHGSLHTESDDDGRFEIRCASQFVTFIRVVAADYAEHEEDYYTDEGAHLRRPGKWKIVLHTAR